MLDWLVAAMARRFARGLALTAALLAASSIGCRSAGSGEAATTVWDGLPAAMQESIAKSHGPAPLVDPEWWKIVRRTCAVNAFANCVCCAATAQACNPTNWSCCGSAVFQPADGSSCSTPSPCPCQPPPEPKLSASAGETSDLAACVAAPASDPVFDDAGD